MIVKETILKGCYVIEPRVFEDNRGSFFEIYNKRELKSALNRSLEFVQDNQSVSKKGVLRGLHYQEGNDAQAKLVQVTAGEALDIVVDLRPESPTFGKYLKTHLSAENNIMLFIPRGMAHGFLALRDRTVFFYKCDNYYQKSAEKGIIYNDPTLNIDWEFPAEELILSEKDKDLPKFKDIAL